MTDPAAPDGLLIGHGGGGPGYAAAAFAVVRAREDPLVAILLSGDERVDVQAQAQDELSRATGCTTSASAHSSALTRHAPRS